ITVYPILQSGWIFGRDVVGPRHKLGLNRQFVLSQAHGLASQLLGNAAADFEQHPTRFDRRYPELGRSLTSTHSGFGRLFGHRLVRENPDPDLTNALHVACHRDTRGFDLAARDLPRFERLDTKIAEGHFRAALGNSFYSTFLYAAILGTLWHQHSVTYLSFLGAGKLCGRTPRLFNYYRFGAVGSTEAHSFSVSEAPRFRPSAPAVAPRRSRRRSRRRRSGGAC